ncbi:MAG: ATP-binding protein [Bacteroidales bacterium]|nr:ATP-binding protein [Bacteroidales bacterium]
MIVRKLDKHIENHYVNNNSAVLLVGARQVGKTYASRKYAARRGLRLVEINFFEDPSALTIFEKAKDAKEILLRISAYTHTELIPGDTLIFFDEVQKSPDVITWIKFLVDDGSYKYALSGSLLGVELKNIRSIPVGYMAVKEVFPLDLEEFSRAIGISDDVIKHIQTAWETKTSVDDIVHKTMMKVTSLYLLIGGMPAAVQAYIESNNIQIVQAKQREILDLYKWDISQYDPANKFYINDIFDIIPSELDAKNKRFVLKNLNEHSRFSKYENGFLWLQNAGVALPTYNVEAPTSPLKLEEQRNLFKLFSNDVGLLAVQYAQNIAIKILQGEVNINNGAIYENLTAQELKAHGYNLYYFNSKKQGEVDFLLENDARITPVEVKSGKDYNRHRALNNIMDNKLYNLSEAIILTCDNVKIAGKLSYLPIYMLMFLQKEPSSEEMIYKIEIPQIRF